VPNFCGTPYPGNAGPRHSEEKMPYLHYFVAISNIPFHYVY
jgi:hypothetical protein